MIGMRPISTSLRDGTKSGRSFIARPFARRVLTELEHTPSRMGSGAGQVPCPKMCSSSLDGGGSEYGTGPVESGAQLPGIAADLGQK
jgi:hypothetical protein